MLTISGWKTDRFLSHVQDKDNRLFWKYFNSKDSSGEIFAKHYKSCKIVIPAKAGI